MANEVNVGKLVAEIILESKTDGADEAISKIKEVNTAAGDGKIELAVDVKNTDDLNYIRDVLDTIGINGTEAEKILSSAFANTSGLSQYKEKLEQISVKIDEQREKIKTLQEWTSSSTSHNILSNLDVESSHNEEIEKEIETLKKLEDEFDQAYAAQDEWVAKQVENFKKQESATETAAVKQDKLNQKMNQQKTKSNVEVAVKTLTSSLRTADTVMDTVIPGAIDGLDNIFTQISTIKDAINDTKSASKGFTIASGIAAGVGVSVSLITSIVQAVEEKAKEAREKAANDAQKVQDNRKINSDIASQYIEVKTKLDSLNLSRSEEIELNETLLDLQGQLSDAYGEEIAKIDLKNQSLQKTLDKLREINVQEAEDYLTEHDGDIKTAKEELDKEVTVEFRRNWSAFDDYAGDIETAFLASGFVKQNQGHSGTAWVANIAVRDEEDSLSKLKQRFIELQRNTEENSAAWNAYEKLIELTANKISGINSESIENWKNTESEAEKSYQIIENGGKVIEEETEQYNTFFNVINENISAFGALQDAYTQLSTGQSLSADTLSELTEKYPQLQKYIIETGDLSLQNGEYLKKVAQDTMESNLDRIDSEKAALEAKGKMTEEEKGYYEELQAKAAIYQSQLEELNSKNFSDLTSSLSSLGSAWSQLNQGKSLDFDTTLSLINQYPQFAQAMADGSISIENQAEVIKRLWEIKKQEAIASVEADRTKLVSQQNETAETIKSLKEKIMLYEKELKLQEARGMVNVYGTYAQDLVDLRKELSAQEELQKNNGTMLEQFNAQIAAINGLTVETYNSKTATEQKNEALAEELKYMEHLKALGQLTAEEELAWLQRINETYTQSLDERYDMEKRLYNAEKAWREEQEKAVSDALQNEYKWIGYNQSLDSLSKQQELDWLLRIRDQYALNAEQAIELQIKIYEAEKALRDEKLQNEYTAMNNRKSLDRLTSEQELEWLERIRATFELNAEQRMELEIKIHNLKKQLADEEKSALEKAYDEALDRLERRKKVTALSYDLEIAYLDEIRRKYKLTAEDAADLEQRIRDLLKDKKDADISALDKLGDAVTEALKNKYEQQRELEEDLINQSIENWRKWEDETTAAIQGQIDALDKLDEAQESEDKRREYELKRQQVELKLAYEKDDYNRKQLQKELNRLDKEEAERLLKEERKAQKEALQQQLDEVKKQSQEQQDALQKELDAIGENYDKLTSSFNLRAETERTMLHSSQKQMIELIKSYAPEYNLAGQSIGESLYNGFYGKYKSIETMVTQIGNFMDSYQRDLARTANTAADNFWANRAEYEAELTAKASQSAQPANQSISLVVNFNEPVESPIQVRRQMEAVVDNLAAEIRK